MTKKRIISFVSIFGVVCFGLNLTVKKTVGSHPGSTGAPLDQTCAQSGCHADAQIIPNAVLNTTLSFSTTDTLYVPGQTYTLTLKAKGLGSNPVTKFGFELVALKDKDSLNVGQMTVTDAVRTQIINHLQGTDNRVSMTHQASGTPALNTNSTEWSFSWTAPPVNEGPISFYYAVNCTNDDNLETGDRIYLSSTKFKSAVTTSLKELAAEYDLTAFFDAETRSILIRYDLKGKREVQVRVFDVEGKLIASQKSMVLTDKQTQKINLGSSYSKGTYIVQLQIEDKHLSKKIIVN